MERTIRVAGKARLSVKPDMTRLLLSVEGTEQEYSDALRVSSEKTGLLRSVLESFSFPREDLRTLSYGIEAVYEGYEAEDHSWKQRFAGYRFCHRLKAEFPSDGERLGGILHALSRCEANPEIGIEYTVSDPDAVRNRLLAQAVADSRTKAAVLSEAAGVQLGEIVTVDYSWAETELTARPVNRMKAEYASAGADCGAGSWDPGIEADRIEVSDTVTVVWAIM